MEERLLTVDEVAWYLQLSHMTIYRMIQRGELRAIKVANQWRFPKQEIDKWMSESLLSKKAIASPFVTGKQSTWKARFRLAHHKFIEDILNTKPDILALIDRREARLFTESEEISPDYKGLTCYYQLLEYMPDSDIQGKYIALLDDSVQHGITLRKRREYLEKRGALVRTFAFIGPETFLSGKKKLEEPGVQVCFKLSDGDYTKSCAQLTDYLLEQGRTQDTDHFMVFVAIRGKKGPTGLKQFLEFLSQFGTIFIVPSPAEENGIVTATLDCPNFLRIELDGVDIDLDLEDGVLKFRFFYDIRTDICGCLALAMPRVRLNVDTYFDTEARDTILPINLKKIGLPYTQLSEAEKALSCRRDISLNLSLIMFEQLLSHLNTKGSPFEVLLVKPFVSRKELQLSYGQHLGNNLSEQIMRHLSKVARIEAGMSYQMKMLDEQNTTLLSFMSGKWTQKRQLQAMFDIMPVSRLLVKECDELEKTVSNRHEGGEKLSLTFSEICQQLRRLRPPMEQWQVSFALDLGLDRTVIAPVHCEKQLGHGYWEFRRSYRPGEAAPGKPPNQIGHGDSKALDPVIYRFRRDKFLVPFILRKLMEYCPTQCNGIEPFLLSKVLACLILDWLKKPERREWSFWEAPPAEFGPLPEIPRTSTGGGNLYELAHGGGAFFDYKRVVGSRERRFLPTKGWTNVVCDYYDDDELAGIDARLKLYSVIFNRLDEVKKKPAVDTLLTLSACFNEKSTYSYVHKNLSLWEERFSNFIDLCRQKFVCGRREYLKKKIEETIISAERTASLAEDKISRYEHLTDTKRTLEEMVENQTDVILLKVGRGTLNRIEEQEIVPARLSTLRQVGELMKAVSTMARYIFSRAPEFYIPMPPEEERDKKVDYYVKKTSDKAKDFTKVEQCLAPLKTIEDEDLNFATLPAILGPLETLYQEVCQSFHDNCLKPEVIGDVDPLELTNLTIPVERLFYRNRINNGIFMFTSLDTLNYDIIQWDANRVERIAKDLQGEVVRQQEHTTLIVFKDLRNALAAAITILQEISKAVEGFGSVPMSIGICRVAYLEDGMARRRQFESKITLAKKLTGFTPADLYVTEDILGAVNELGIKCSVYPVPKGFDTLGQKVYTIHWNLVDSRLLSNPGKPFLHLNILRKLEELAPMNTLPLLNIYSKEEQGVGSYVGQFCFLLVLHFLPDLFGFLLAIARVGGWPDDICLVHKPYPYKNFQKTKQALIDLGYKVFSLPQRQEALRHMFSRAKQCGKQIIVVEDGGYITPLIHNLYSNEIELFRGVVEQTTKGVDRVKAQIGEKGLKLPYRSVAQSRIKAKFESPDVADAAVRNIRQMLPNKHFRGQFALVIGYGNIGTSLAPRLKVGEGMIVGVCDRDSFKRKAAADDGYITDPYLPNLIGRAWLILGATGNMSIGENELFHLQNNSVLVSVSSDQEEISPNILAKFSQGSPEKIDNLSTEYILANGNRVLLLGNGFPINFVGAEGIPNETIDLVLSELYLNTIDLACGQMRVKKGIDTKRVDELSKTKRVIERWEEVHEFGRRAV